jgi:hypothetical protein
MDFLMLPIIAVSVASAVAYIWPSRRMSQSEEIAYTHGAFAFILARLGNGEHQSTR